MKHRLWEKEDRFLQCAQMWNNILYHMVDICGQVVVLIIVFSTPLGGHV